MTMGPGVVGLNWFWIAFAALAPLGGGLLVAWPIWLTGQPIFGNIVGSLLMFGSAVGLIMREHAELDAVVQACIAQGTTCWPDPSAFTRFAIYAFIALAQVIVLFTISVSVEHKQRRKRYAPEWR
jgi:hypothetical protein